MLRRTHGALNVCQYGEACLSFNGFATNFNQGVMTPGRDGFGQSINTFNTGFGFAHFWDLFSPASTWGFHADFSLSKKGANFSTGVFYQMAWSGGAVLQLNMLATGKMQVLGPTSAVVATTSTAIPDAQYITLEVKATGLGTANGTLEVRFDRVTVALAAGVDWGLHAPDRLGFLHTNGSPETVYGNYLVWDDAAGDEFTDFTGPLRIDTLLPIADDTTGWTPSTGNDRWLTCDDNSFSSGGSPNGDVNYISPGSTVDQLFTMAPANCFGRVMAVAVTACARPTSGVPTLGLVFQPAGASEILLETFPVQPIGFLDSGNQPAATKDYFCYQTIQTRNPASGNTWTDQDITAGSWGVEGNGIAARVTAFFLEKVTSLIPQPFDCGSGPYTF